MAIDWWKLGELALDAGTAYAGYKGAKEQRKDSQAANKDADAARKQAVGFTQPGNMLAWSSGNKSWSGLYPGLFGPGYGTAAAPSVVRPGRPYAGQGLPKGRAGYGRLQGSGPRAGMQTPWLTGKYGENIEHEGGNGPSWPAIWKTATFLARNGAFGGFGGFAAGGEPPPGMPAIAGEMGPEKFIPDDGGEAEMVGEGGPEMIMPEEPGRIEPSDQFEGMPPQLQMLVEALVPVIMQIVQAAMQGQQGALPMSAPGAPPEGGMAPGAMPEGMPMDSSGMPPGGMPGAAPGMIPSSPMMVQGGRFDAGPMPQAGRFNAGQPGRNAAPSNGRLPQDIWASNPTQPGMGIPEMTVAHTGNMLANPGQTQDIFYQRAQEQANQGLNTARAGITGDLTGRGFSPDSGMGQMMGQSAALSAGNQRNEAARDQSIVEEGLRREDIQTGITNYQNMLATLMGFMNSQAAAAVGGGFPQIQPVSNGYNALGTGMGTVAALLASEQRRKQSQQQQGGYSGRAPVYQSDPVTGETIVR